MIAKGLDYPDVTVVGVINADTSLHLPDFRARERTYQLLEQVSGRAGRGEAPGRVVIQTYWPEHPAIVAAARHEPAPFYEQEAADRRELGYPPFGRLANVLVWGTDAAAVRVLAMQVDAALRSNVPSSYAVVGPSPCPLAKLKGVHRWHVLVKAPEDADISSVVSAALGKVRGGKDVSMAVDVDPADLL